MMDGTSKDNSGGLFSRHRIGEELATEYHKRFSSFDEKENGEMTDVIPSEAVLPERETYGLSSLLF